MKKKLIEKCYFESLMRIKRMIEGDDKNVRAFVRGLLEAMQMGDVIAEIKNRSFLKN